MLEIGAKAVRSTLPPKFCANTAALNPRLAKIKTDFIALFIGTPKLKIY
jgi:hypothetical protein